MTTQTFTKTAAPAWLLAMWKDIDDKTFGAGFDCFAEDAVSTSASPTGGAARRSGGTCATSSTAASPRVTTCSNSGTAPP